MKRFCKQDTVLASKTKMRLQWPIFRHSLFKSVHQSVWSTDQLDFSWEAKTDENKADLRPRDEMTMVDSTLVKTFCRARACMTCLIVSSATAEPGGKEKRKLTLNKIFVMAKHFTVHKLTFGLLHCQRAEKPHSVRLNKVLWNVGWNTMETKQYG